MKVGNTKCSSLLLTSAITLRLGGCFVPQLLQLFVQGYFYSTIHNLWTSILMHFWRNLALEIKSRSIQFGTSHFPVTFILAEFICDEAQPVPIQTPQQPQHSFHTSRPAGRLIFLRLSLRLWRQETDATVECHPALLQPTDGEDQTQSQSHQLRLHSLTIAYVHVPLGKSVHWLVCVKLRRRSGRRSKRPKALDSYVLLTICSLSPFLKVRSDAVLDS